MADKTYTPTTWATGDAITADKLNNLEQGVTNEQVGPQGPAGPKGDAGATGAKGETGDAGKAGAAGKDAPTIKSIALTTDTDGKVTGGTATLSDSSTVAITVTAPAAS